MGGDFGPQATVPAAKRALDFFPHLSIFIVGDQKLISPHLIQHGLLSHPRITLVHTTQVVNNDDSPLLALRSRNDSSMCVALELVQQGKAQACVSGGNTGALMALSRRLLKALPGIDRPALVTLLPTVTGKSTVLLDLGANTSCDSDTLVQFAVMGTVLAQSVLHIKMPRVSLLNIGSEAIKGNDIVRQTAQALSVSKDIHYCGYVEGHQLFEGDADVIVCEGFVGNVALKTAEGTAAMVLKLLKSRLSESWWRRMLLRLIIPGLSRRLSQLNPDQYNGASLLGLRGIVVKSHGRADEFAFYQAIVQAVEEIRQQVPARITDKIESILLDKP
jgi:glycerol-3-phosphate acyltransferase PlsX